MTTEYVYTIKINKLKLKQEISFLLPHFFNPSTAVVFFTLVFDESGMIPIIMPLKNIQVFKYRTFLGKNNTRFLKRNIIDFFFQKRLSKKLTVLFFLIEKNELNLSFSEILKKIQNLIKDTNRNINKKNLIEHFKLLLKTNLKQMNCDSICLLDLSISLAELEKGYHLILDNKLATFDLIFKELDNN